MIVSGLKKFFYGIYKQLFIIDDTIQKTALGFGLGVFLGLLPGTGPIAALFCSLALRVNRAATLLGALITNTWLSIVTFLLAIQIGSLVMGMDWIALRQEWSLFLKDFHWADLLKVSIIKIIAPVLIGYLIVGIVLGIIAYLAVFLLLSAIKSKKG